MDRWITYVCQSNIRCNGTLGNIYFNPNGQMNKRFSFGS